MAAGRRADRSESGTATYVYCLLGNARVPPITRSRAGLPGAGAVRLVELEASSRVRLKRWLAVSSVPLDRYGSDAINQHLHDLDWVSRAAIAHERVVESFAAVTALVPMKLFTIFADDDRARAEMTRQREEIDAALSRVAGHDEWGVRVVFDPAAIPAKPRVRGRADAKQTGGAEYLAMKKARRDQAAELAERSRDVTAAVYERLAKRSSIARRRTAADLPAGGTLLMEAAFLVPRPRGSSFRTTVSREARTLMRDGYQVTLTGPWPAYSFVKE